MYVGGGGPSRLIVLCPTLHIKNEFAKVKKNEEVWTL